MVHFSKRAVEKIQAMQAALGDPAKRLRVFVEAGGCSGFQYGMAFDTAKVGDLDLEDAGVRFRMDAASHEYMKGSQIDFDDGLTGKGFEIRNPNAQQTCGCGKSFN